MHAHTLAHTAEQSKDRDDREKREIKKGAGAKI